MHAVPEDIAADLTGQGIHRVVLGHTPHGNCPSVMKSLPGLMVITADTSYSNMKASDNRGEAVSEVIVLPAGRTKVHGVTHDRTPINYTLSMDSMSSGKGDDLVGDLEPESSPTRRFVKARLSNGKFLMCHVDGYTTSYDVLSEAEVIKVGKCS